jgi:hypothetical protein
VALAAPARRHLGRAVETQDQDPARLDLSPELEQQVQRAGVRPVQIVQHEQQWLLARQRLQHPPVLGEQARLRQRRRTRHRGFALDHRASGRS